MKKILTSILAIAAAVLISGCDPVTYDTFFSISGRVYDQDTGDAIANAQITLTPNQKNTYTGSDGTFEFVDLEVTKANYSLQAQADGYSANHISVRPEAGRTENVAIPLKKKQ